MTAHEPNLLEKIRKEIAAEAKAKGTKTKKPKLSHLVAISDKLPFEGKPLPGVSVDDCNTAIDQLLRYGVALTDLSLEAFEESTELRGEHQRERITCQLNLFMWTTGERWDLDAEAWVYDGDVIWNGDLRAYKGPHDFRQLYEDLRYLLQSDAQEKSVRGGSGGGTKSKGPTAVQLRNDELRDEWHKRKAEFDGDVSAYYREINSRWEDWHVEHGLEETTKQISLRRCQEILKS